MRASAARPAASAQDARGGARRSGPSLVSLDGSSTVFPISEAVAEEFQKAEKSIRVTVGISGTGGGFQKFCRAEIDISDASRPISATEVEACKKSGVEYIELPIAYDGIAIAVNPKATWADKITVAELKTLWAPDAQGKVTKWSQVRKGWPDREIHLFGAGVDSGTYDYFTEAINGKAKASRGDFTSSEDDNVLVQGIANDELALGFLPFAYFEGNHDKLKLVPVDDGKADNGDGADPAEPRDDSNRHLSAAVAAGLHLRLEEGRGAARSAEVRRVLREERREAGARSQLRRPGRCGLHAGRGSLRQADAGLGLLGREHGRRHHRSAARERKRKVDRSP